MDAEVHFALHDKNIYVRYRSVNVTISRLTFSSYTRCVKLLWTQVKDSLSWAALASSLRQLLMQHMLAFPCFVIYARFWQRYQHTFGIPCTYGDALHQYALIELRFDVRRSFFTVGRQSRHWNTKILSFPFVPKCFRYETKYGHGFETLTASTLHEAEHDGWSPCPGNVTEISDKTLAAIAEFTWNLF